MEVLFFSCPKSPSFFSFSSCFILNDHSPRVWPLFLSCRCRRDHKEFQRVPSVECWYRRVEVRKAPRRRRRDAFFVTDSLKSNCTHARVQVITRVNSDVSYFLVRIFDRPMTGNLHFYYATLVISNAARLISRWMWFRRQRDSLSFWKSFSPLSNGNARYLVGWIRREKWINWNRFNTILFPHSCKFE